MMPKRVKRFWTTSGSIPLIQGLIPVGLKRRLQRWSNPGRPRRSAEPRRKYQLRQI